LVKFLGQFLAVGLELAFVGLQVLHLEGKFLLFEFLNALFFFELYDFPLSLEFSLFNFIYFLLHFEVSLLGVFHLHLQHSDGFFQLQVVFLPLLDLCVLFADDVFVFLVVLVNTLLPLLQGMLQPSIHLPLVFVAVNHHAQAQVLFLLGFQAP